MADNFLEKRYDEVFGSKGGGRTAGPSKPSLDQLLSSLSRNDGYDDSYVVHPLQLDAIISSVTRYPTTEYETFSFKTKTFPCNGMADTGSHEGVNGAAILVFCEEKGRDADIRLGEIIRTIKLKAAELGLSGRVLTDAEQIARITDTSPAAIVFIAKSQLRK